jgi:protein O-mannosyl-transferase
VKKKLHLSYLSAGIALLTFIVYTVSLRNKFIDWDDPSYVTRNLHIRFLNIAFVKWAFFDFYMSNWHPLAWFSHALDYALWRLNPAGHHLTNNLLHAANTFLVVSCIALLLQTAKQRSASHTREFLTERAILITAAVTGLLFGLHPIHVESVAWISERKDLLCAFFFLLSIIAYLKFAERQWTAAGRSGPESLFNKYYLLSLGSFALALLSKPMAVTLPMVLLMLDWYPLERITSFRTCISRIKEKIPFFIFSLGSSMLTVLAQQGGGAIKSVEFAPFSTRLLVAAKALVAYIGKIVFPVNFVPFYPYPSHPSLFSASYGSAVLLVAGITVLCLVLAKTQKVWLSVCVYYGVTLAPVLGLVLVGKQSMADRYTYLPGLGPFLVIGLLVAWADSRIARDGRAIARNTGDAAAALVLIILISLTVLQIGVWKDSIVFWSRVIRNFPSEAPFAYKNRGLAYAELKQYEMAMDDYNKSLSLDNTDHQAFTARGALYGALGRPDKALEDFNTAVLLDPDFYETYYHRALVSVSMGKLDDAATDLDRAISRNPFSERVLFSRASLYIKKGQLDKAIECLDKAIALNPANADLFLTRGAVYVMNNSNEKALADMNKAIDLNSHLAVAYYNRGTIHQRIGNAELARTDFRTACNNGFDQACVVLKGM